MANGKVRPSSFLVSPTSSRTTPATRSTWDHRSGKSSEVQRRVLTQHCGVPATLAGSATDLYCNALLQSGGQMACRQTDAPQRRESDDET